MGGGEINPHRPTIYSAGIPYIANILMILFRYEHKFYHSHGKPSSTHIQALSLLHEHWISHVAS